MPDQGNGLGLEPVTAECTTIGGLLRRQREAHGLSVDDVKKRLRIQRRYVEAMEDDRFADLPGRAYASAYLRAYARDIGLDPDKIMAVYNSTVRVPIERPITLPADRSPYEQRGHMNFDVVNATLFVLGTGLIVAAVYTIH